MNKVSSQNVSPASSGNRPSPASGLAIVTEFEFRTMDVSSNVTQLLAVVSCLRHRLPLRLRLAAQVGAAAKGRPGTRIPQKRQAGP